MKNFAIIGVAGYVAPRHLKAIKEVGGDLLAALDKFDSVGILDSYFPEADFFVEFERFDRHLEKLKRQANVNLDFLSICTPNYLHDSHIRMGLRSGASAICEKPLVLNPWNLDALESIELESEGNVYSILQLRYHPAIQGLKKQVLNSGINTKYEVDLTYIVSRGSWYDVSWKGDVSKSGGVALNIGVHFFDMLGWVFGKIQENFVHYKDEKTMSGYLEFEKARVRWYLSIDGGKLPDFCVAEGKKTYRSITVNNEEIEFSEGFTDLHTVSYEDVLSGGGYGIQAARESIELVYDIRCKKTVKLGEKHFLL